MITTEDRFNRLLKRTDEEAVKALESERIERVDMLDAFAGLEGFDEQVDMLKSDVNLIDAALARHQQSQALS